MSPHVILTGGYELDAINSAPSIVAHNLKLGVIASF